ncbi:MAG TPA: endonuclease domain-containing protein [Bacteroidota bacterium]|nr:endonuclease domain-containing protein [Bacteroidota bacterium]
MSSNDDDKRKILNQRVIELAKKLCRELRRRSTRSEQLLWQAVRNRQLLDTKFYRHHPIFFERDRIAAFIIVDFYCHDPRFVIEIDGKSHDYQKDYDELRTYMINSLGIPVYRFKNEEFENNMAEVLSRLKEIIVGDSRLSRK